MAVTTSALGKIYKVTKTQYDTLVGGTSITDGTNTYTYDSSAIYLVDDGLTMPTTSGSYVLTTTNNGSTFSYTALNCASSTHTHSVSATTGTSASTTSVLSAASLVGTYTSGTKNLAFTMSNTSINVSASGHTHDVSTTTGQPS